MSSSYKSYRAEYSTAELELFGPPRRNRNKKHPLCPVCHTNTYVKRYSAGLVKAKLVSWPVGQEQPLEPLSAPLTCIDEGYSYDCPGCLIIFDDEETDPDYKVPVLTKSDYQRYLKHPAWLWLNKYYPDTLPQDEASQQTAQAGGMKFEDYAEQLFADGVKLGFNNYVEYLDLAERTAYVIEEGCTTIIQAGFDNGRVSCISDVVQIIGDNEIDLYEIKSSTSVKPEHITDLAFQAYTLEQCGYTVRKVELLFVNNRYVRDGPLDPAAFVSREDVTERVRKTIPAVKMQVESARNVLCHSMCPELSPRFCGPRAFGDWMPIFRHLEDLPEDSIYDLCSPGVKRLEELEDREIMLMKDIPDDIRLTAKQQAQVTAVRTGQRHINAPAIRQFMEQLEYPLYFLDYETFAGFAPAFDGLRPYQQVPFQYSLHIHDSPDAPLRHEEFLHQDTDNPARPLTEALRSHIGDSGTILAWNASFEKGCNDLLGQLVPEHQEFLADVNSRVVDLMQPFAQGHYVDKGFCGSASIKKVLPVLVPSLSYKELEIHDGGTAQSMWMRAYLEGDDTIDKTQLASDLLRYCGLDTEAMVRIYEVLRKHTATTSRTA